MTTAKAAPEVTAIVLAAGLGTRMKSAVPKVLHAIAGRPLLSYAVRAALAAGASRVVVVASGQPEIARVLESEFGSNEVELAVQDPPRGTGDAVRIGLQKVTTERVLILYGDTPLLRVEELSALLSALDVAGAAELSLITCELPSPKGYGRILRDAQGQVSGIREERDLKGEQRAIREVNAGMYAADSAALRRAIALITPNNAQAEYYFTDVVASLAQTSRVSAVAGQIESMLGVNDRAELRAAEELMFERIRVRHAKNGVTVRGGARIDDSVEIGQDALIEASACLRGATRIGPHSTVDSGCVISDSVIGASVHVKPHSVIVESRVGDAAEIGPFSHMRPGSDLEAEVHIGNFVETKKTHMGRGAKANHLSYLGDGDIGAGSNIGAGTIFCNYDGFQKHRTVIGEGAFIGSDSQLVAPVSVGNGAYVASGTAVTHDVPDGALAIGRVRQENKLGYGLRLRERLAALARAAKKR